MKTLIIFIATLLWIVSCASNQNRAPSSAEEKSEETHQKFQGLFDRPY